MYTLERGGEEAKGREERRRRDGNNRGGVKGVLTVEGLVFSKRPTQDLSIGKATG